MLNINTSELLCVYSTAFSMAVQELTNIVYGATEMREDDDNEDYYNIKATLEKHFLKLAHECYNKQEHLKSEKYYFEQMGTKTVIDEYNLNRGEKYETFNSFMRNPGIW